VICISGRSFADELQGQAMGFRCRNQDAPVAADDSDAVVSPQPRRRGEVNSQFVAKPPAPSNRHE
jgi:hypothetical protein